MSIVRTLKQWNTFFMVACTTLNLSGFVREMITLYLIPKAQDLIPIEELNQLNVIYKVLHHSLLLHIQYKLTSNAFLILTQEIIRDITSTIE